MPSDPLSDEVRFAVRLTPRGGADRVDGVVDGVLRVRVAAPPVDGAANTALIRLLARELDVPVGSATATQASNCPDDVDRAAMAVIQGTPVSV